MFGESIFTFSIHSFFFATFHVFVGQKANLPHAHVLKSMHVDDIDKRFLELLRRFLYTNDNTWRTFSHMFDIGV